MPRSSAESRVRWTPTPPELSLPPVRVLRCLLMALPGVLILAAVSYQWWDYPTAQWVHHAPRWLRKTASAITELGHSTPIVAVAVALAVLAAIGRKWVIVSNALLILLALALTGLINTTLKFILGRARPSKHVDDLDRWTGVGPDGFFFFETSYKFMGFPSGHSATAGAVAAVGLMLRPKLWPLWLAFAAVIPATRVLTNAHYIADTIVGTWVGATCATLAALGWQRWSEKRSGQRWHASPSRAEAE